LASPIDARRDEKARNSRGERMELHALQSVCKSREISHAQHRIPYLGGAKLGIIILNLMMMMMMMVVVVEADQPSNTPFYAI
jgi:hypothetical protein